LEFVRQHPNWSAFIVFGLSLGESLPLVSLVLPFWAMLVGIGTIIAVADPLIFWTIVAAAAIGAEYPSSFLSLFKSWVLSSQRSGR
jgi:membrane protein DedA with SNARE-associated domain